MKKRIFVIFMAALLFLLSDAQADRIPVEKPCNYIGAILYSCIDIRSDLFVECEYQGVKGYALRQYLRPAPQYEPPVSSAVSRKMTREEIIGEGEVVLEWKDYNMSVIAAREYITEKRKEWEVLRVGCFINDQPVWGHEERCVVFSQYEML